MYILGIDFGTKKLGLAILEDSTDICSPLPIIQNDIDLWNKLAAVIANFRITTAVIGLASYEETEKKVRKFAAELTKRHQLSTYFVPEDNTSIAVKKELTTKKQKRNLDSFSAMAILQQWRSTASAKN